MATSWMLRRVALVRTDVSEELRASFIRVTRIVELGTTLAITSTDARCVFPSSPIIVILMKETLSSSETSVLTGATGRNIPEDIILYIKVGCYFLMYGPRSMFTDKKLLTYRFVSAAVVI
jgi:hypothetical protein